VGKDLQTEKKERDRLQDERRAGPPKNLGFDDRKAGIGQKVREKSHLEE